MTVCISALTDDGRGLVLVSDQMITANIPISYEFETGDVKKIHEVDGNVGVLTAGNALYSFEVVRNSKKIIQSAKNDGNELNVEQISAIISREYQNYRRNIVIKRYLEPRGLDLQSYTQIQQNLHAGVVQEIEGQLGGYNMGVEMIVAGLDNSQGTAHIYSITHPGIMLSHDALGYTCVGSGGPHATYNLIGSSYKKSLPMSEVEKILLEAKSKAEVAPGVGEGNYCDKIPK